MQGGMWLNQELALWNHKHGQTEIFMSDYSAFDSSVPAWLIRDVFQVIIKKYNLTGDDLRKFRLCINHFINIPVQNSNGRRFKKSHGIPSGSMFTNIIGSLVNMVITWIVSE
ncbi:hypothetical protein KPH14_001292 [Odynerus spinipes]|uniref:RdRp catalytic domain-containing protein n=1 Tax=Odynerus spinipes TaxID=1348599 RepID=A0AAD9VLF6_9HYME|nr:hypothetical protein KPH14_001292 [Odynerus spinipes]